jgi:putative oxidoreductase
MPTSPSLAEHMSFGRQSNSVRDSGYDAGYDTSAYAAPWPGTMLIGRALMAAIFFVSGAAKLMDVEKTVGHMTSQGIPEAHILVYVAAIAELAGAAAILFGFLTRVAAFGLIVYVVLATVVFHDFWTFTGEEQRMQMIQFLKNLAIIGGLAFLVAQGAGRYSLDAKIRGPRVA